MSKPTASAAASLSSGRSKFTALSRSTPRANRPSAESRRARGETRRMDEGDVEKAAVGSGVDRVPQAVVMAETVGAEGLDAEDAFGNGGHCVVVAHVSE